MQTSYVDYIGRPRANRTFRVTRRSGSPVDLGDPGDIHLDTDTDIVWVCYGDGLWSTPRPHSSNNAGLPLEKHPTLGNAYRLFGLRWLSSNAWYSDSTRRRRNAPAGQREIGLPTASSSEVTSQLASSTLPTAIRPSASTSAAPQIATPPNPTLIPRSLSANSSVATKNPSNSWLQQVLVDVLTGPASLVPGQIPRIVSIFHVLFAKEEVLHRIGLDSGATSSGCTMVGAAMRDGPPPRLCDAIHDAIAGKVQLSNTVTNFNEAAPIEVFLAQQYSLRSGIPIPHGQRAYVAFDIRCQEGGLGRCRWGFSPFREDRSTAFGEQSNCWTPAGAVTFPHTDDFACGMYIIHWMGKKLWLLWPPTVTNLRHIEITWSGNPTVDDTLRLVNDLEGLQILYMTEEEFSEVAFFLRPGTIHSCISVTESCHAGRPIRSLAFIPEVEACYASAVEWMDKRVVPSTRICDEEDKAALIDSLIGSINHWSNLSEHAPVGPQKTRLDGILSGTRAGIERIGKVLGFDVEF